MSFSCPADNDDAISDSGDVRVVFVATADLPHRPLSPDELQREMAAAQQLISAKYHAGDPLLSKDAIRDVVQQLDKCKNDSTLDQGVSITGLDGRSVWFPVETGNEYKSFGEELGTGNKRIKYANPPFHSNHTTKTRVPGLTSA